MRGNAGITVYHKQYDPGTRLDKWTRVTYECVNWYGKRAVSVGSDGLHTADTYTVRIYTGEEIHVAPGDCVLYGLYSKEITRTAELPAAERFVVTAVRDNRRGSPCMRHWRIEGA